MVIFLLFIPSLTCSQNTGDKGAAMLASCLPRLPGLHQLVLTGNNLTDTGADALRKGLLQSCDRCVYVSVCM
jgi:hypothetical protein